MVHPLPLPMVERNNSDGHVRSPFREAWTDHGALEALYRECGDNPRRDDRVCAGRAGAWRARRVAWRVRGHHGGNHFAQGGRGGGGFGPFFGGFGVGIPYFYPPIFVLGPGMFLAPDAVAMPAGPLMPPPVPGMLRRRSTPMPARRRAKAADPGRAAQLMVVGDRLLRPAT